MMDWQPANPVEMALLDVAAEQDRQGYFQLIAVVDLFLPQVAGDASAEQVFLTVHAFDHTFLPVFTSVEALVAQFRGAINGYTVTNYAELRRKWPNPAWRLAINPGTPVDAYVSIDGLAEAALGDTVVPTLAELARAAEEEWVTDERLQQRHAEADYPDDPDRALLAAARAADAYGYVNLLLDRLVLVPTTRAVEAEAILEPGFPWRYAQNQVIEVFTNAEAFARSHPDPVPAVEVALPFALAMWPEGYGLSVNPGGDDGIEVPAEQVQALLVVSSAE
jgi:hypothetical protein